MSVDNKNSTLKVSNKIVTMFVAFSDGKRYHKLRSDSRYAMLSVAVGDKF